jgi:hypothetical protein
MRPLYAGISLLFVEANRRDVRYARIDARWTTRTMVICRLQREGALVSAERRNNNYIFWKLLTASLGAHVKIDPITEYQVPYLPYLDDSLLYICIASCGYVPVLTDPVQNASCVQSHGPGSLEKGSHIQTKTLSLTIRII